MGEVQPRVADVPGTIRRLILESRLRERVKPGGRIALGIGSRGISVIPSAARAAVEALQQMGYRPFIVAAMGSHGGATPEGQRALLDSYGISEATTGVPVSAAMRSTATTSSSVLGITATSGVAR